MTDTKKQKMPPRSALGRGLSALISTPVQALNRATDARPAVSGNLATEITPAAGDGYDTGTKVRFISISSIANNPTQPRQEFKEAELKELSDSIRTKGILQPVLVRPAPGQGSDKYEIIAGERRWRAAKLAGLTEIPAIVRPLDDRETLEIAIIENVQRENLSPIEEAQAYQRLAQEFNLSQQEIADKVGKDRTTVANLLRLLKLPAEVIEMIKKAEITMGHAKAILTIKEPAAQLSLARKVIKESLSVRDIETIASRVVVLDTGHRVSAKASQYGTASEADGGKEEHPNAFPEALDRMRNALGTKVAIRHHRSGRGRIEIEYFSEQELDRIVEEICR